MERATYAQSRGQQRLVVVGCNCVVPVSLEIESCLRASECLLVIAKVHCYKRQEILSYKCVVHQKYEGIVHGQEDVTDRVLTGQSFCYKAVRLPMFLLMRSLPLRIRHIR